MKAAGDYAPKKRMPRDNRGEAPLTAAVLTLALLAVFAMALLFSEAVSAVQYTRRISRRVLQDYLTEGSILSFDGLKRDDASTERAATRELFDRIASEAGLIREDGAYKKKGQHGETLYRIADERLSFSTHARIDENGRAERPKYVLTYTLYYPIPFGLRGKTGETDGANELAIPIKLYYAYVSKYY